MQRVLCRRLRTPRGDVRQEDDPSAESVRAEKADGATGERETLDQLERTSRRRRGEPVGRVGRLSPGHWLWSRPTVADHGWPRPPVRLALALVGAVARLPRRNRHDRTRATSAVGRRRRRRSRRPAGRSAGALSTSGCRRQRCGRATVTSPPVSLARPRRTSTACLMVIYAMLWIPARASSVRTRPREPSLCRRAAARLLRAAAVSGRRDPSPSMSSAPPRPASAAPSSGHGGNALFAQTPDARENLFEQLPLISDGRRRLVCLGRRPQSRFGRATTWSHASRGTRRSRPSQRLQDPGARLRYVLAWKCPSGGYVRHLQVDRERHDAAGLDDLRNGPASSSTRGRLVLARDADDRGCAFKLLVDLVEPAGTGGDVPLGHERIDPWITDGSQSRSASATDLLFSPDQLRKPSCRQRIWRPGRQLGSRAPPRRGERDAVRDALQASPALVRARPAAVARPRRSPDGRAGARPLRRRSPRRAGVDRGAVAPAEVQPSVKASRRNVERATASTRGTPSHQTADEVLKPGV